MNFFGFGQSAEVEIALDTPDNRPLVDCQLDAERRHKAPLYYDGETVSGRVLVTLRKSGHRLEHQGIRVEFVGQIEMFYDRGNHHEFVALVKDLARPGDLTQNVSYAFEFGHVEKPYETYFGSNVKLRYLIRVTMSRRLSDLVKEQELVVHTVAAYPLVNNTIKMEVGIEEALHIEFEYNKSKYHLHDVIVGKIYFLLVRVKIKHMELSILRKEFTGYGPGSYDVAESVLARFEIMDGAPVRGESIPIRLFLAGYPDLSPTMKDVQKKFSIRYFLNLVLVDEEDRRYFKQQEIVLWRRGEKLHRPAARPVRQPISAADALESSVEKKIDAVQEAVAVVSVNDEKSAPQVNNHIGAGDAAEERADEVDSAVTVPEPASATTKAQSSPPRDDGDSAPPPSERPKPRTSNIFGDDDEDEYDDD